MYLKEENLAYIAKSDKNICLIPKMANRHGLITGATGTGKTVTLKVLAESFSDMGTPVFLADVKGDVTGTLNAGCIDDIQKRLDKLEVANFECKAYPTRFFDVFSEKGIPVRTTISEMGPELLARLLELTDVQSAVLSIVFRVADDEKLLLIDLKDLREMVKYVGENSKEISNKYGSVSSQSIGGIQRALLRLEDAGGNVFFGEPELNISDLFGTNEKGQGYINILECEKLVRSPLLYSTFLLWLLSELYENLPEEGDLDKPKIVFFFDEAHLLFNDAPKVLTQKVEQIVRLIRSKGVGVYFISQKPSDIPENILAQLGNKIQHALRAYTPSEQKVIKAAAQSFRANPLFDTEKAITELGTGEAVVSFLDEEGVPMMAERALILPPASSMKAADEALVKSNIESCNLYNKYKDAYDRVSAYELLTEKAELDKINEEKEKALKEKEKAEAKTKTAPKSMTSSRSSGNTGSKKQDLLTKTVNSATSTIGRKIGNEIARGIIGIIKKSL